MPGQKTKKNSKEMNLLNPIVNVYGLFFQTNLRKAMPAPMIFPTIKL